MLVNEKDSWPHCACFRRHGSTIPKRLESLNTVLFQCYARESHGSELLPSMTVYGAPYADYHII